MEFKKVWMKTKNALLVLLVACVGFGASSTIAWGNTAQSGFDLDYFHAYRAARTYAISLQNGLSATFDFRQGTATLYYGPQQITLPLNQVFLQAANGNSNLATRMYNQMYGEITAAHSDMIAKSTGVHTNSLRALSVGPGGATGIGDQNDSMWGWPDSGSCWPVPVPCDQWPDGPSGPGLGTLTYWFNTPFGDDPLTSQPPNPGNCAPDDIDCRIWENDRKNACNQLIQDGVANGAAGYAAGDACIAALGTAGALTPACGGGIVVYVLSAVKLGEDMYTCNKPYPGK
ncbi:MAG TPA: hypothetical protein VFN69_03660 [Rudaea sp.]|nr:hypothetical protein [Rudaea sp.]